MTMALLKTKDIRAMRPDGRDTKLKELNDELMHERGVAAMGGAPASPGKIRAIRTNIARIMTIQRELELTVERPAEVPKAKSEKKPKAPVSRPEKEAVDGVEDDDTKSLDREDQEEKK
jgi:large subunit ribosomal protein L29